ncbi:putative cysteine-rich secretory family protein [Monocercomonoides exilis]|uniref:putative cysteine-rich secretory family protein n=1 Tax=Monocercomonoides exilis TaxID=2049356 RepID=UPI00355ABE3A|nr:putative cysteine-rich secretory family protein [Monocercomonoides exilis]|eukprot:MONOS_7228.1-p1 / transcript=MONOS_7228.1 / gene=MONOS_7228 / organism=Monocercomonoides_exilis_PA203 / gene_product=cysteine-rich secretory family protein / transcript_product=cysteine-rich secretory family protein / location=Mono_scaffold00242:15899-16612(+) / protein_length=237 / sequence_SO=supercontig / SO=protein_coding / is_pseudo=false
MSRKTTQTLAEIRKQNLIARGLLSEDEMKMRSQRALHISKQSHEEAEKLKSSISIAKKKDDARSALRARWLRERKVTGTIRTISTISTGKDDEGDKFLQEASKVSPGVFSFSEKIGREALRLTNEFRAKNRLPPCVWSKEIHEISKKHSQQMANHEKGFDHSGFEKRIHSLPFSTQNSGENIFRTNMEEGLAEQAVSGWISSPGHRRNLLGKYTLCGIGTVEDRDGMFFITQIFATR